MAEDEKSHQGGGKTQYAIEPYLPEDLVAHFSNSFHVVSTGSEIYLSFLQPEVPLTTDTSPDGGAQKIRNKCVARIVLTPKGLNVLIDILTRNRDRLPKTDETEEE